LFPVDGYVTNLLAQFGNYVMSGHYHLGGQRHLWVDGYFEETNLSDPRW
jgi:multidrug resistance efflux pump